MNAKWLNTKSLTFKLWIYFVVLAAGIMLLLWLLQIMFLGTFYEGMKRGEVQRVGEEIARQYGTDTFYSTLYQKSFESGVMAHLLDESGNYINGRTTVQGPRPPQGEIEKNEFSLLLENIGNDEAAVYTVKTKGHMNIVAYGQKLTSSSGNTVYLYVSTPLAPIDATTQVLKNQLLIVTCISLLFAFVLSYFISRRLSRPISNITVSAGKLAKGDYSAEFSGGPYTEINELADALNYATRELKKTDELRRDFLANVSHDLRTPLTIIKSYAEMIRDISGDHPEKRAAHTQVIIDEADRLSLLVTDILDLSKMESGTQAYSMQTFDFKKTILNIVKRFECLFHSKGYSFQTALDEPAWVTGDEQKIEQVLYNLLGNAVEYAGENGTITVCLQEVDGFMECRVQDSGSGIREEDLPMVWERYYRASQRHQREHTGTGIGLSIVKSILTAHQAPFGVKNGEDGGAVFWFRLKKKEWRKFE